MNGNGQRPVVVAARRTPIGRIGGAFATTPIHELLRPVLTGVLDDLGLTGAEVDDVIVGNAGGSGGNPARYAALFAGLGIDAPAMTVDRQCGSGLEAVNLAAGLVAAGRADVVLAGGAESSSTAPWRVERPPVPHGTPRFYARPHFVPQEFGDPDMGVAGENVARLGRIGRERQDRYALESHRKALAAAQSGRYAAELVPVEVRVGRAGSVSVTADECPRPDTTLEKLARLKPVFAEGGTVTAGNACPVNDGAAMVAVVSERKFRELGLAKGLRVVDAAVTGVDPEILGWGPVPAVRRLLKRNPGITLEDIALVEFTEAFAGQVLACLDELGIPEERVNRGGGAIALGHPWGASGAVLVTRLFSDMFGPCDPVAAGARYGLATLGAAGGLGIATLFERHDGG
ncbi:thiolase family protein [Streptomyces sp. NPDC056149]|uniref:thiolase family protein n=1 Tax=unclassified Streptomyces TaxID=2593676 RepID=UPI002381477E|nr:thiolase family protein [Streptomyces sp. WZ-12]